MKIDKNDPQFKTPFFTKLKEYSKKYTASFDVPGHKRGAIENDFSKAIGKNIFKYDSNAPYGLDFLNQPSGVIKESEELAAKAYNANKAYFITGGTTLAIIAMIMTCVKAKEKIILPRNVHKSVINSLILSGSIPVFIKPIIDEYLDIATSVSTEEVIKTIKKNKDAKAILIINPTYYGGISDLKTITQIAHENNMLVLVDEAHGGNLYFSDKLPLSAMECNADICAISSHKTNLSLTQSSLLLLKGDAVSQRRLTATINILQSTSPSQLLVGSIDTSRKYMYFYANKMIDNLLILKNKYVDIINKIPGIKVMDKKYFIDNGCFDYDETKMLLDVTPLSITGSNIYKLLAKHHNVQLELAEEEILLCVLSVATKEKDFKCLVKGLNAISKEYYKKEEFVYPEINLTYPKKSVRPREAYHGASKVISINDSLGCISSEMIMIYPPGIPLIIPGEIVDSNVIKTINNYIKNDLKILQESERGFIKVLVKGKNQ
ncbi:MAG: aminotransferase class I/II-fold pyridoxal phosphate-dependent enzyme [Acholeplasmatales bacterium]|jgi:lysine decarboxylase|nr:aminotransferase class I/II-fold pyridoxal phosphate-dependent enzyme [Acholeplasmatales bacterium]